MTAGSFFAVVLALCLFVMIPPGHSIRAVSGPFHFVSLVIFFEILYTIN